MTCSGTPERRPHLPAGLCALLLAGLLAAGCGSAPPRRTAVDLTNPFLGPEYSQWLVGAVALLATPEEVEAFLALQDDAAAGQFVSQFWERRDPSRERPGNPLLEAFEQRAAVADRLYSEAGYAGRRTARGTLYILYGRPKVIGYDVALQEGAPPVEVWTYGGDSPAGLTGRTPEPVYRFVKRGDLTVPYVPLARPDPVRGRVPGRLAASPALSFGVVLI